MPKRSITNAEVSLIKAMLTRGMRNRDIQFYFNRQERPLNAGRISEIKSGAYGEAVDPASESELDVFLAQFEEGKHFAPHGSVDNAPTDAQRVAGLFQLHKGDWRLTKNETDEAECKREIDLKKLAPVVRAIAGLANNKGGVVLLGVEDKSAKVVGLATDEFERMDLVKLTHAVKAHLQPTPSFRKGVTEIGGRTVGYVIVEPCKDRPVIIHRPGDRLDDGAILFRYPAETTPIKFGDLKTLLEDRDARRLRALAAVTQRIAAIGIDNSAVLNTADGTLDVGVRPLMIDKAIIDQINFIREGAFDETNGAPTLKLIGEVTTATGGKLSAPRRVITDDDVLRNFLDQEAVFEPVEYLRFAVSGTNRDWLPIFFFARQGNLSEADMIALIKGFTTTKRKAQERVIARAKGERSAIARPVGTPAKLLKAILEGDRTLPKTAKEAGNVAVALQGLPDASQPREELLALLKSAAERITAAQEVSLMSYVYHAAGRLDQVYFGFAQV